MFKFLIYLFLIYMVVRFLFSRVAGPLIKVKTFHYHANTQPPPRQEETEGKIIIEQTQQQKTGGNDKSLGEYVDYEEVK